MNTQLTSQPNPQDKAEHYEHVGAYLREIREHYGLSVEDVATRLHIRHKYISAIELGQVDILPGKVYTLGYLQSYAEFLGLNPEEIVSQYQEIMSLRQEKVFRVVEPTKQQGLPNYRWALLAGVAILVVGALWLLLSTVQPEEREIVEPVPDALVEQSEELLVMTLHNKNCLSVQPQPAFPACFSGVPLWKPTAFLLKPVNHKMELYPW